MRDADPRKSSSGRNSRRPGGRSDGTSSRRRHVGGSSHGHGISGGAGRTYESPEFRGESVNRESEPVHESGDGYFYYDSRHDSEAARRASRLESERASSTTRRDDARDFGEVASSDRRKANGTAASRIRSTSVAALSSVDKRRVRRFALSLAGAYGVVVLFVISLALIGVTIFGGGFTPLPAAIASLWMVFNVAPFGYNGTDLGLIPLVPSMLMVAFIAWRVRREVADRISLRDVRALAGSFIAAPLVLTFIAWLMLLDASRVLTRVNVPNLAEALASTLLVSVTALGIGMGQRLIRALLRRRKWPEWLLDSARLAATYVAWLWGAGAVVTLASLAWHHQLFRDAYVITANASEASALTALSVLYLPNVAFAAAGILVGAPVNIGTAEAGLFAVTTGTMPPLPVLAAFPQSYLTVAFGALLLIPVTIAVAMVARYLKRNDAERPYVIVVVAAVWAGVLSGALAWLSGGVIGVYGWSGASVWLTGLLASMWLAVPGAVVVIAMTGFPKSEVIETPAVEAETFPAADPGVSDSPEEGGESAESEDSAEADGHPAADEREETVEKPEATERPEADAQPESAAVDDPDAEGDHAEEAAEEAEGNTPNQSETQPGR